MNARVRSWINAQVLKYETEATNADRRGADTHRAIYRQVANDFRNMVSKDPWLGRLEPTASAEIMAQQIYESFGVAAHEHGHTDVPFEKAIQWANVPKNYRAAMVDTAGDILRSGMIEMIVGEAMHRERMETSERALRFWHDFEEGLTSMSETRKKMRRLAEGYVDD